MPPLNERLDKGASHEAISAGYRDPQRSILLTDWQIRQKFPQGCSLRVPRATTDKQGQVCEGA